MAYVALTDAQIAAGAPADQTLFQKIKDNLDFLYGMIGSLPNTLPNGSFEIDSDNDGTPDGGTSNLYPGGSMTIEETFPLHGNRGLCFTSPGGSGNGGGYWTFDYIEVGQLVSLAVSWFHLSSVATIHNLVEILWFDEDKVALSGGNASTIIYDSAANPVVITHTSASALSPAGARFAKIRLTGAKSDNAAAGWVIFDGVAVGFKRVDTVCGTNAENTSEEVADRIYIDGSLASQTYPSNAVCGVATGISGGRGVTVQYRTASTVIVPLSLTLPVGLWTITATGARGNGHNLTALAIREI